MSFTAKDSRSYSAARTLVCGIVAAWLWILEGAGWAQQTDPSAEPLPTLTTVREVHQLTQEQAAMGYPVKLTAVVTFSKPKELWCFVQDSTMGIACVRGVPTLKLSVRPGQQLVIEGVTRAGGYAPNVGVLGFTVTGEVPLPEARPVQFGDLISGRQAGQRVEIAGVIRSVHRGQGEEPFEIQVASGGRRLPVVVLGRAPADLERWVDGVVRVRGVCGTKFNKMRQMNGVSLNVPHADDVIFDGRAESDPYSAVTRPIQDVMRFAPESSHDRRVKVRGTVVQYQPNRSFHIEDATSGILVLSQQGGPLTAGDQVEVLGFPEWGEYAPQLEDATFRRVGRVKEPQGSKVTADELLQCHHDGRLVTLKAELMEQFRRQEELVLVLKAGSVVFNARLTGAGEEAENLRNGSVLSLTGVCRVQMAEYRVGTAIERAEAFDLVLRSLGDIEVVRPASWWTEQRAAWLAGGLSVLLLGTMAWNTSLRQRVRRQTEIIAERLLVHAALEERERMARELHDTVEQDLAAVALHLGVIADQGASLDPVVRENLDAAFLQVRRSQTDAHRAVWDLRSTTLTEKGLAAALEESLALVTASRKLKAEFSLCGQEIRLPCVTAYDLLRLGGEAMTNAVCHGAPQHIRVNLTYDDEAVTLQVRDDGCGFDVDAASTNSAHRFGLIGMHERAAKIGARLVVSSKPGAGTIVEVVLPLEASASLKA